MTNSNKFFGRLFGGKPKNETQNASDTPPKDDLNSQAQGEEKQKNKGFFERLAEGLSRSTRRLSDDLSAIVTRKPLDQALLEELEESMIAADLGAPAAARVVAALAAGRFNATVSDIEVREALSKVVAETLAPLEKPFRVDPARRPHVVLVVGVNGAGKTTTIGKIAARECAAGRSVMIAAGDTFRAAAIEQLQVWGDRAGAQVIARATGADAAGLAFDALEQAKANGADLLLIDTAGRLQNRKELMDELAKIVRVLKKLDPQAPHDTLLVLDATVGQNALSQADVFTEIAGVTGLAMTKLDGSARGGVLVALAERKRLPIQYVGVGEQIDDLQDFSAVDFARALAGLPPSPGRR
jgi:fused signal recognition particle receptor